MKDQALRDEAKRAAYEVIRDYLIGDGSKAEEARLAVTFLGTEASVRQVEEMSRYGPTTAPVPIR